ncbi:MAG: hypothetical protein ACP5RJ_08795 [Conexivisphaera sp.]
MRSSMPLEDYLIPGENILVRNIMVSFGDSTYELIVTDKRLLLYARRGLISKKDDIISIKMSDIQNIMYREEGLISKKGILLVDMLNRRISLYGSANNMKAAYQNLMSHWGR